MSQKVEYFGKYILLEKLAMGGMAEVFLARAPGVGGVGKFVAMKRILPQYSDNKEFIDMFKDEAKIAINLSHGNVVSINEFGSEANQLFIVMDYVEGRNLRQILNKMKKGTVQFSIDQIIYMAREVAAGLDHAHRCLDGTTGKPLNITHRDMSPQNVMVSFEGEVKIVDFGIAKAESQLETTRAGTLKGKFGYMSPEQAEGQTVDLRTDIFSLGIVLWELLANDRLFIANNEINTLRKIRDCQVPSLRKINPNIHPELERITLKALARDRNLRYQTAAALHRDLSRFLNRQYPDFSHHDFSVFIKTMYADEILDLRKRLISYSQVSFEPGAPGVQVGPAPNAPEFDENKVPSFNSDQVNFNSNSTGQITQSDSARASTMSQSFPEAQTQTSSKSGPTMKPGDVAQVSLLSRTKTTKSDVVPASEIPTKELEVPTAETREAPMPNLDSKALKAQLESPMHVTGVNPYTLDDKIDDTPDLYEDADTPQDRLKVDESSLHRYPSKKRRRHVGIHPSSIFLFLIATVASYQFLVWTFPEEMKGIRVSVDRFLGSEPTEDSDQQQASTTNPEPPKVDDPPVVPPPPPNPEELPPQKQAEGPKCKTSEILQDGKCVQKTVEVVYGTETRLLTVTSNPSGAEIYVNGINTGESTPAAILVPTQEKFEVSIKKFGYIDLRRPNLNSAELDRSLSLNMQKMALAYLTVDVKPPRKVRIFIDDQFVTDSVLPLTGYAVPATKKLTIRAEDPYTGASDRQSVVLGENEKRTVILRLQGGRRVPAKSN